MNKLDQFYTQEEIAQKCIENISPIIEQLAGKRPFFIEPSAGDGSFYNLLPAKRRFGMDIDPKHDEIVQQDFLWCDYISPVKTERTVIIGNPPFGKRGHLAVQFMNKAFNIADTVAFIVPVIFQKYFIHKQLPKSVKWIHSYPLKKESFRTAEKNNYSVNTEFQVWTRLDSSAKDMRLLEPPATTHPDFTMWQYNNTKEALKVFKNDFEFAVPCQGFQDYTRKETKAINCEKHKQWMLFKPHKTKARKILNKIDYHRLSTKYTTSIPGFRKGDMVKEYEQIELSSTKR